MSAILKFDFQKWKQLHLSKENYLSYTKDTILHVTITLSLKQGQTRASSGPITPPLRGIWNIVMARYTYRMTLKGEYQLISWNKRGAQYVYLFQK